MSEKKVIGALAVEFQAARDTCTGIGVCSAGLSTTALPGASFQAPIGMVKFHGMIFPTMLSGSRK